MIIFKIIVGLASAQIAKWFGTHPAAGLVIGAFFGHFLDLLAYKKFLIWKYRRFHTARLKAQAEADFLFCFFTLAGKICLADNEICKSEEAKIDSLIKERFKFKRKDRNLAKKYFLGAAKQNIAVQTLTSKLVEVLGANPTSLENTVHMLKDIALADGTINQKEFKILFTVASVLGMDPDLISQTLNNPNSNSNNTNQSDQKSSKNSVTPAPEKTRYEILNCKPNDPIDKIKRSYRELVAKYHPDKIMGKELPQDFIDFAAHKFKEVQTAYEFVKKERGF